MYVDSVFFFGDARYFFFSLMVLFVCLFVCCFLFFFVESRTATTALNAGQLYKTLFNLYTTYTYEFIAVGVLLILLCCSCIICAFCRCCNNGKKNNENNNIKDNLQINQQYQLPPQQNNNNNNNTLLNDGIVNDDDEKISPVKPLMAQNKNNINNNNSNHRLSARSLAGSGFRQLGRIEQRSDGVYLIPVNKLGAPRKLNQDEIASITTPAVAGTVARITIGVNGAVALPQDVTTSGMMANENEEKNVYNDQDLLVEDVVSNTNSNGKNRNVSSIGTNIKNFAVDKKAKLKQLSQKSLSRAHDEDIMGNIQMAEKSNNINPDSQDANSANTKTYENEMINGDSKDVNDADYENDGADSNVNLVASGNTTDAQSDVDIKYGEQVNNNNLHDVTDGLNL